MVGGERRAAGGGGKKSFEFLCWLSLPNRQTTRRALFGTTIQDKSHDARRTMNDE